MWHLSTRYRKVARTPKGSELIPHHFELQQKQDGNVWIYPWKGFQIYQTPTLWQEYQHYNYILAKDQQAWIFDPGEEQPLVQTIEKYQLKIQGILLTHHHHDHTAATAALKARYSCPVYGFTNDLHRLPEVNRPYEAEETLSILGEPAEMLFVPGHTLGHCAPYFPTLDLLFSSDLIFSLGCGRVFEGSFDQMYSSLDRVARLPSETLILSSHEYTLSNLEFSLAAAPNDTKLTSIEPILRNRIGQGLPTVPTTLSFETQYNLFLRTHDPELLDSLKISDQSAKQAFKTLRQQKDRA